MSDETAVRVERATCLAADVLGNLEAAEAWMGTRQGELGWRTPVEVLDTEAGFTRVTEALLAVGRRLALP